MMIPTTRVFVSQPIAITTAILLLLNIVTALMYYIHRPKLMPTGVLENIASTLELFDGSGLVKE